MTRWDYFIDYSTSYISAVVVAMICMQISEAIEQEENQLLLEGERWEEKERKGDDKWKLIDPPID